MSLPDKLAPRVGRVAVIRWWVVAGLGARGMMYHAWLGQLLAAAAVADDETMLPRLLTRWRCPARLSGHPHPPQPFPAPPTRSLAHP